MARLCPQMDALLSASLIQHLRSRKIFTVVDFMQNDPEWLAATTMLSYKEVLKIRNSIMTKLSAFPQQANRLYDHLVTNCALIPTGIERLDQLLEGGLLTGQLYEVCGFSGCGKTQLCITAAMNVVRHLHQSVHYIDTKMDFCGRRVAAMLEASGCTEEETGHVMHSLQVTRVHTVFQLFTFLHHLKDSLAMEQNHHCAISTTGTRLIVIDSLPVLFFPFLADGDNEWISLLNHLASTIKFLAQEHHLVFLMVNSATRHITEGIMLSFDKEDISPATVTYGGGDGDEGVGGEEDEVVSEIVKATLGKYWSHVPSTRLFLEKETTNCNASVNVMVVKSTTVKLGSSCCLTISNLGIY